MTDAADFAKRLDQTADDTERLLAQLLSDTLLPDEIARPKRLMDAMRTWVIFRHAVTPSSWLQ